MNKKKSDFKILAIGSYQTTKEETLTVELAGHENVFPSASANSSFDICIFVREY